MAIVAIGVFLRLFHYFYNRLLWVDEAMLSLNVINYSVMQLFSPLVNPFQIPPIGFLLIEKFAVMVIGSNEFGLRLFPLAAGISSLIGFGYLLKNYVNKKSSIIATYLYAISVTLIYYSSEVKQYSSDALVTVLLLIGAIKLLSNPKSARYIFF